jgi:hypothetical protein
MRLVPMITALVLLVAVTPAGADSREAAAEAAALKWLALIDSGAYEQSWSAAASLFQAKVTQAQWEGAAAHVRGPLGAVQSRKLQSATFTRTPPGAPQGQYVIIQYSTVFANRPSATETVTPMKDTDGAWHVAGYYIK